MDEQSLNVGLIEPRGLVKLASSGGAAFIRGRPSNIANVCILFHNEAGSETIIVIKFNCNSDGP